MKILYTQLSVEEALARLGSTTGPAPGWKQWLKGRCASDAHSVWGRLSKSKFELGMTGRGILPPILYGSLQDDQQRGCSRISYRVYGAGFFALIVSVPNALVWSVMPGLTGPKIDGYSVIVNIATAILGTTIAGTAIALVLRSSWKDATREIEAFMKDTLEASEQPPAG